MTHEQEVMLVSLLGRLLLAALIVQVLYWAVV